MKFINSKISIWDYFGNPQATYLSYTGEEKSKMFREYYNKLVDTYFRTGNLFLFVFARVWLVSLVRFLVLSLIFFFGVFLGNQHAQTQIDSGISRAVRDANKISMTKNIFGDNRIETTVTAEKTSFNRNIVDV